LLIVQEQLEFKYFPSISYFQEFAQGVPVFRGAEGISTLGLGGGAAFDQALQNGGTGQHLLV
jgi:hypothetical protein